MLLSKNAATELVDLCTAPSSISGGLSSDTTSFGAGVLSISVIGGLVNFLKSISFSTWFVDYK